MVNRILYCCMAPECQKTYKSKFNLKRHVDIVHLNVRQYKCSVCDCTFTAKQSLKEHSSLHSSLSFRCNLCPAEFRQNCQLQQHTRKHVR